MFNTSNNPWMYYVSYVFPLPILVPLVLSKVLADMSQVNTHFILVAPCWMEVPCLATVLNMLEYIPCWFPIIKDFIRKVLVGLVLKSLSSLYLTLWLHEACCEDKTSLPHSDR